MSTVLVTGGSGFLGSHCIVQLLQQGHTVHTTVRSYAKQVELLALLRKSVETSDEKLAFFTANLTEDEGWAQAITDCDYVLHVASPFPSQTPKNEDEVIRPAREGVLRILKASQQAGIKRVVLTSSFGAIGYGHYPRKPATVYDETYWTNLDGRPIAPYIKSKVLAERDAWEYIESGGNELELTAINPVGIFGPALGKHIPASLELLQTMLNGGMPACPRMYFGVVDVRDVADLHIRAMQSPKAAGERFLASAGDCVSMHSVASILRENLGEAGEKVPCRELPNWLVRLTSLFKPELKAILPQLGIENHVTNEKAKLVLDWKPRSNKEAIVSAAESIIAMNRV